MNKKLGKVFFIGLLLIGLSACDNAKKQETTKDNNQTAQNTKVSIACTEVSCAILEPGLAWMSEHGVDAELVMMDGNVNVIRAVNDNSVDAALGVHLKFMENFNQQNNGILAMVKPYPFTTGIGLYSERYNSLADIPNNAKIAIMNDAMNMDRGLRMLRDAKLIGLDQNKDSGYTLLDITDNPKNFEFIDMDQSQTVRALQDVDASVVFFTHMRNAGKDFRSFIIRDNDAELYPMAIVVRNSDENKDWAKTLALAVKSEPVRENIAKEFGGVFEYYD